MGRFLLFLLTLSPVSGTIPAEPSGLTGTEQLLAEPPEGWRPGYRLNDGENRIIEYGPSDEDSYDWMNKLVFESFPAERGGDPIELLLYEVERQRPNCEFLQHFNLFSGRENGYPTSLRLLMCGKLKSRDQGEVTVIKAIQGLFDVYVIRISRRIPPFKPHEAEFARQDIAGWATYLRRIKLCHTSDPRYACPSTADAPESDSANSADDSGDPLLP